MFAKKKYSLLIGLVITCCIFKLHAYSDFPLQHFIHETKFICTWDVSADYPGSLQQYKGTEEGLGAEEAGLSNAVQVLKVKWDNNNKKTSVQMCCRHEKHQVSKITTLTHQDNATVSPLQRSSFFDCFQIEFLSRQGMTTLVVNDGHFEPSLTRKTVNTTRSDTASSFLVEVYARKPQKEVYQPVQNTTVTGHLPDTGGLKPLTRDSSGYSDQGSSDDDPFRKPRPKFLWPDIHVIVSPYLLEESGVQESAGEPQSDISINVNFAGQSYVLILSQEEWGMLVERNLHRSAEMLFRLVLFQNESRLNRKLLLQELDNALNEDAQASRISQLLNEHNEIPPEKIYLSSWLTATYLHLLLQETGIEIIAEASASAEDFLKKLEYALTQLAQSNRLQQALMQYAEKKENDALPLMDTNSIDELIQALGQTVDNQWKELVSKGLAAASPAHINPTPTICQASTGTATSTTQITDTDSNPSDSTPEALQPSPAPKSQQLKKGSEEGEEKRPPVQPESPTDWETIFHNVFGSIVRIEYLQVTQTQGTNASSYVGTGFVVDAERGIILTNRHLGTYAPVIARARFNNQESVEIRPLYSDPVNDFGFYQYTPSLLQENTPKSLPLVPSSATVGTEVMLAGCDVAERAAIFISRISDLERASPDYDFNTFYILATAGTSGGSSGSPVINHREEVVALNSGKLLQNNRATSGALLQPVVQAKKALTALQNGQPVPRGSIQTKFIYKARDRLAEMNLSNESGYAVREAGCSGLLTVNDTIPQGSADDLLLNGDIVLKINGQWACNFDVLVNTMNENVGNTISLEVERNGQIQTVDIEVADAHKMDPDRIFQISAGQFMDISYHYAQQHHCPLRGVYISDPGIYFFQAGLNAEDIIQHVGGVAINTLDDFIREISRVKNFASVGITYQTPRDTLVQKYTTVMINRDFHPTTTLTRRYGNTHWKAQWHLDSTPPSSPPEAISQDVLSFPDEANESPEEMWRCSLVQVEINFPFPSAGRGESVKALGVIVDSQQGLVLIDGNRLSSPLADIRLIFNGSVEIPATIFKQHPKYPMAILKYDPSLVSVPTVSAQFSYATMNSGQKVRIVALNGYGDITITDNQLSTPFSPGQFLFAIHLRPKKIADFINQPIRRELFDATFALDSYSGMLVNEANQIIAFSIFPHGTNPILLDGKQINQFIQKAKSENTKVNDLGIGVTHITALEAKRGGLTDSWIRRKPKEKHSFMRVSGVDQTASVVSYLNLGDLILAVNDKPVYDYSDLEELVQGKSTIEVTFLRNGKIQSLDIPVTQYPMEEFDKVVNWQGMTVHAPLRTYREISSFEHGCVFISRVDKGSPAQKAAVWDTFCVASVDGKATSDVDTFLEAVQSSKDKDIIKIKTIGLQRGEVVHVNIRPDFVYFPTRVYQKGHLGRWKMNLLETKSDD